ncbi:hypothetical protein BGZ82_010393 [Podila clonocystis]|nr:hypothetical protein BGZ82_010393 [Podila clonocystis]
MRFHILIAIILAIILAVSAATEDTNTVLDGVTRSKHHSGPHNEYDVDEANKIMTTLPYLRSKWILPIGAHYKHEVVYENGEENEAAK